MNAIIPRYYVKGVSGADLLCKGGTICTSRILPVLYVAVILPDKDVEVAIGIDVGTDRIVCIDDRWYDRLCAPERSISEVFEGTNEAV